MSLKISQLPPVTALSGTELVPVVQDGVTKNAAIGGPIDTIKTISELDPMFPTDTGTLITHNVFILAKSVGDIETPAIFYKESSILGLVLVEAQNNTLFTDPNPGSLRLGNTYGQGSALTCDIINFYDQTGTGSLEISIFPANNSSYLGVSTALGVNGSIFINDGGTPLGSASAVSLASDGGSLLVQLGDGSDFAQMEIGESLSLFSSFYSYTAGITANQVSGVNHLWISGGIAAIGLCVSGGISAFNVIPPTAKTTLNAAATDLPTVIALTNQIRALLIALGFAQ